MKGPFERLKYDLRRVFECPKCHHKERVDSTKTVVVCRCQAKLPILEQVVMKLVEDHVQRRFPLFVPPVDPETESREANADDTTDAGSAAIEVPAEPADEYRTESEESSVDEQASPET